VTWQTYYAVGIGSTINKDRQNEKLSEKALHKLEAISSENRIPVFSDHDHSWEKTMGYIDSSKAIDGKWHVSIALEDPEINDRVAKLISKKQHGTPIGLSIGGRVPDGATHYEKNGDGTIRVINDLELFELSFVGIPANQDGSVMSYITKSLEGEEMTDNKQEVIADTQAVEAPIVKEAIVEKEVTVQETKVEPVAEVKAAEVKEDFASKKDLDEVKKSLLEEIAKQIAQIQPVKKSVVVETAKELETTDDSIDKKFDEAVKKRFNLR
jgi:phage head maturation protease